MEVTALCRLLVNVLLLYTARGHSTNYSQDSGEAVLHVAPDRLQFFDYESISVNCVGSHSPAGWKVMRRLSSDTTQQEASTGVLNITAASESDSGEYWCENGQGDRFSAVNISVTGGNVILESPAVPVMEGDSVTLRCRERASSSIPSADFYKDGRLIRTEYKVNLAILGISINDSGLYSCNISGSGASPQSWLTVREDRPFPTPGGKTPQQDQESPLQPRPAKLSVLFLVFIVVLCLAVLLLVLGLLHCWRLKATEQTSDPVYENVGDGPAYAQVRKQKRNAGVVEEHTPDLNDVSYATVRRRETDAALTTFNSLL